MCLGGHHSHSPPHAQVGKLDAKLGSLGPMAVLDRGYSLVTDKGGAIVRSAHGRCEGEELDVRLRDGSLTVEVKERGRPEKS